MKHLKDLSGSFRTRILINAAIFVSCLMLLGTVVYAETIEQKLESDMKTIYAKALSSYGASSFNGYCGNCTGYQLKAAGVFNSVVAANGNQSYEKYKKSSPSSGASVTAFPGKYCFSSPKMS